MEKGDNGTDEKASHCVERVCSLQANDSAVGKHYGASTIKLHLVAAFSPPKSL